MALVSRTCGAVLWGLALAPAMSVGAQTPTPSPTPTPETYSEYVQVTATRIAEPADEVPGSMDVITGEELRDRGATDLRSALALAAGVEIAPGGDGGPASTVPEFWGLKEFDAFLLVVDGVPWGGAFNPALSTLDLHDVERIEVQRGGAPVMYGATSFVGVIHVVHRGAGDSHSTVSLNAGSYGTGGVAVTAKLPRWAGFDSTLNVDAGQQGFKDDRTQFFRGHVLWRNSRSWGKSAFRFDVDATWLDQDPASPHPREGKTLSASIPLDSNHNPEGAFLNERRFALSTGYDRPLRGAAWSTTLSVTHSSQDVFRGFLTEVGTSRPNARGFRADIGMTDVYLDSHLAWTRRERLKVVAGVDHLHGNAEAKGDAFDYFVDLDGTGAPGGSGIPLGEEGRIEDRRDFSGLYGFVEWTPAPKWRVEAGTRMNRTEEERGEGEEEANKAAGGDEDKREVWRLSGSVGVSWTAWQNGRDHVRFFADYRNTFKPAAQDFNLAEGDQGENGILKPETAQSYEVGLKTRSRDGAVAFQLSGFLMDFRNLVVAQSIGGLPALVNAGKERFKGLETSVSWRVVRGVFARATYALHDAKFREFLTVFDGVPTELAGKRLEMSAHHLGGFALTHAPEHGVLASIEGNYLGSRFLNKRNTALAEGYTTVSASVGYRTKRWEGRLTGRNLGDRRDPVAESELGDAQYYRMTARRFDVSGTLHF